MALPDDLDSELGRFGVRIPDVQKAQLRTYLAGLGHWNRTINLTALEGEARVRRLVVEPLWVLEQLGITPAGGYLDIGSGNGSPAIPWRVRAPFASVDLVESRGRRAAFLREIARQLRLPGVTVHRSRFEDISPLPEPVRWITLQGVRLTPELLSGIQRIAAPGALAIWLTQRVSPPITPDQTLPIPFSEREALIFRFA